VRNGCRHGKRPEIEQNFLKLKRCFNADNGLSDNGSYWRHRPPGSAPIPFSFFSRYARTRRQQQTTNKILLQRTIPITYCYIICVTYSNKSELRDDCYCTNRCKPERARPPACISHLCTCASSVVYRRRRQSRAAIVKRRSRCIQSGPGRMWHSWHRQRGTLCMTESRDARTTCGRSAAMGPCCCTSLFITDRGIMLDVQKRFFFSRGQGKKNCQCCISFFIITFMLLTLQKDKQFYLIVRSNIMRFSFENNGNNQVRRSV